MNFRKAYERRHKLQRFELEHLQQLIAVEITNYKRAIENYSPANMEKYGKPFLRGLQTKADDVAALLAAKD